MVGSAQVARAAGHRDQEEHVDGDDALDAVGQDLLSEPRVLLGQLRHVVQATCLRGRRNALHGGSVPGHGLRAAALCAERGR